MFNDIFSGLRSSLALSIALLATVAFACFAFLLSDPLPRFIALPVLILGTMAAILLAVCVGSAAPVLRRIAALMFAGMAMLAFTACSTTSNFTPSQQIEMAKGGLTSAKMTLTVLCASDRAPAFCRDTRTMAKVDAVYDAAKRAMSLAQDALAARDGDQAAIQRAIANLVAAVAEYNAVVDAFADGKPPA